MMVDLAIHTRSDHLVGCSSIVWQWRRQKSVLTSSPVMIVPIRHPTTNQYQKDVCVWWKQTVTIFQWNYFLKNLLEDASVTENSFVWHWAGHFFPAVWHWQAAEFSEFHIAGNTELATTLHIEWYQIHAKTRKWNLWCNKIMSPLWLFKH